MAIGNDFLNNRINFDIERDNNFPKVDNEQKPSAAEQLDEQNKKAAEKKEADRDKEIKEAVYGEVIGVSENGDVATAKEESVKALEDGMVFKKTPDNTENTPKAADENKEQLQNIKTDDNKDKGLEDIKLNTREEEITSLTAYTDDQLQTLYTQGKIDKIKYDQEIERRKELMQEDDEKAVQETKDEQKNIDTIKTAQQDEDKDEEDKTEDKSKIKEEIEKNEKAIETLGRVYANESDEQLRAQAVEEALKSGRMDIVEDIFNGNQNN